ncbi:MAG: 6,7-dimethyl-8-ribityllumazine synthase [Candidatus Acidiferrum sp.]
MQKKNLKQSAPPEHEPATLRANIIEGALDAAGLRLAIAVSRFNGFVTERLLSSAVDALAHAGVNSENVDVIRVPGAFELPLITKKLAASSRYDALIAIGCILRGETSHYDYVCAETSRGLQLAQMDTGVPIMFCVLTCDTPEQALERAGTDQHNKGREAALGAIEMARLSQKINAPASHAPNSRKARQN